MKRTFEVEWEGYDGYVDEQNLWQAFIEWNDKKGRVLHNLKVTELPECECNYKVGSFVPVYNIKKPLCSVCEKSLIKPKKELKKILVPWYGAWEEKIYKEIQDKFNEIIEVINDT